MRSLKSVVVGLVAMSAGVASAQTQVKPRVLLIVDTSGSMTSELTSNADTGADGSNYLKTNYSLERGTSIDPQFAYGVGYSTPANTCSNTATYRGQTSRMYAAKQAVSNVVNGSGDVDWGLARYAGNYCNLSSTASTAAFLLGCNDDNQCSDQCCDPTDAATGNCGNTLGNNAACRCQNAGHCPTGYVCAAVTGRNHNTCIRSDRCDGAGDCASGQSCNGSNRCTCTTDDHCRENEFCIGGVCLYDPNLCQFYQYGMTDRRGIDGIAPNTQCLDKRDTTAGGVTYPYPDLPITYGGSCGTNSTSTALDGTGCGALFTCTANSQCETGRTCAAIPGTLVANSGASACTCATNADCDTLPVGADGRAHVGYTCASGFCTYTQGSCSADGAVRIVDPRAPNATEILKWLNNREDYTGTNGAFLTAGNPVATINVADPELRASGLTPVGGSLRSAASWYRSIKTAATDAQIACRPYITVILTDGVDTCEGNSTQDEWGPPAGARKFVQETVAGARIPNKVYVIGLSVTLTSDRDRLNAVATAGGTGLAKFVSSSAEIEAALADILAESILFEKCNGVDDDCDGLIDEGFGVYEECVPTTTRAQGTPATTFTCPTSGRWPCANTTQCSSGYACTGGFCVATCTAGLGPCQATGVRACQANGSAACNATPLAAPGVESTFGCNNRDDDCDGYIDDCTDASPNTCSCGGCTGTAEICNGLDDDCVGGADNSPVDVGLPCGVGACAGTTVCSNAGTSSALLTCNGGTGTDELCNMIDDDCDGVVDNFTEACPPVSGQCDPGVRTCTNGSFGACTGVVPGGTEVCNGLDDDCDGTPDDSVTDAWLNTMCCPTGNNADCCTLGTYQCMGGAKTCVGATIKGTEVCDGADNDCNGMVDDVAGIGQACTSGSVVTGGTCTAEYVCTGTAGTGPLGLTCTQVVGPTGEVCNGLDDDCDGTPDNNITSTTDPRVGVEGGAPCMALPDGQKELPCMPGTTACEAGEVVCKGYVGPQPNLCDGISRDCTGMPNMNGDCPAGFECYQGNCVTPCGMGEFPCQGGFVCDPVTRLCIPDVCNKLNCPTGQICELADDGSAVCKDPCENITCPEGATCTNGVCASTSCKDNGCPTGQICQGTPAECVADPCATKVCEANEYCNVDGECERICENVCLSGTVCIDGTCQNDPCAGKNCPAGQVCVLSGGNGVCVESFCGNECGTSGRVCCGGSCRPDPCSKLQCPVNTQCQLDPACGPQCVAGAGSDPVQVVGAGGGGVGCAAAGTDLQSGAGALLLLAAALAIARRNRRLALVKTQRSLR